MTCKLLVSQFADLLDLPHADLRELGTDFTEDEIWVVMRDPTASRRVSAWPVIRADVMWVFDALWLGECCPPRA
jgi:hypothetical protein